uniref:Nuclear pore protein n=1 Tax=Kalanchoe fedtschenkoi TaxID=63787 RepID=A0A7N0UVA0_KALFE
MANDADMSSWTNLLHSSTKLLEQAAPSAQFPPLQRNLDQLEVLSKKLKAKTQKAEATSQSIAATRLLAREGINAEQLARDLKSFELKTTIEDVFPSEATSIEEYLQQVHEMAMVSAVQEAQKDNLKGFNDYMMKVLEEDWQKEKRDFLQSLSRIALLPQPNKNDLSSSTGALSSQIMSLTPQPPGVVHIEPMFSSNGSVIERKAFVYSEVVKNLNNSRERGIQFNPASAFRSAYESLGLQSSIGKSVSMQKIWHLVQALMFEGETIPHGISKKFSLVIGARHHLELGHEKYIMDTIHSHPTQAALGGVVGNLQKVRAFLRIRLRDYGVLDFDAGDVRRQPPLDTTWQQIYFCLRTGYYDEAKQVAISSRVSHQFAPQLNEWISTGGMVSSEVAATASEECEKMLRMGDRGGRSAYDKKKLLLYAIISGSRRHIDRLLKDIPTLFNTIEDFLWFTLAAVRECVGGPTSVVLNEGLIPYSLEDLQAYLNKFDASYYTKKGKDPLVYPYILLLSIQLLPAVSHLSKEHGDEGFGIDAAHIAIVFADSGILSESTGLMHKRDAMDACMEASDLIKQYGSAFLRAGNLAVALEYYAQAAASAGGGHQSWTGRADIVQKRRRNLMLKHLLMELLLSDGGIYLLLGPRGAGDEGELRRFLSEFKDREQFLLEAAHQCQESGLYDKSVEMLKRVGAFSTALDIINKCLSEAISALARGKLDGDSRTAGLIQSGNAILETYNYYTQVGPQERELVLERQTELRQLEAILSVHNLAIRGHHLDALREMSKFQFLPLDPRGVNIDADIFHKLSPHVQACIPDLLKVALSCMENITDSDGSLRTLRSKIANFVANNSSLNWPRDLYEKVARSL